MRWDQARAASCHLIQPYMYTLATMDDRVLTGFFVAPHMTSRMLLLPLFAGVMGLKPHKRSCYLAMVARLVAFVGCSLSYWNALLCMAVNGLVFFGSHYWHHGGFVTVRWGKGPTT